MRLMLLVLLLLTPCLPGCSKSDQAPSAATNATTDAPGSSAESKHPAALSASAFLNALAAGDEPAATGRLTPLAAEQMAKNGKRFAFSAVDAADFRVTKLWLPQPDEAAVEYHMAAQAGGESVEFDVCCFMRNVAGDWRLGGIAYDLGGGEQPVVVNYEAAEAPRVAQPTEMVASPAAGPKAPQTAHNPAATQVR